MNTKPIKILTFGTGAIGSFYSACLASAGADVTVVCRSDYDEAKERGIFIKSYLGDFSFCPKVIKNIEEYRDEPDFVIVATKVLPSIDLPKILKPILSERTSIVLIQNGINIEKPILQALPNQHLISVIAFIAVSKMAPAMINHESLGRIIIGDYPNGASEKTKLLCDLFSKSKTSCQISENIQLERWKKLVWNIGFNPTSVLAGGVDTAKLLNNSATKNVIMNIMGEVAVLAKADNCELSKNIVQENIALTEQMPPYKTSMLLDFEAKRPMEVEAILGNALRFAEEKNIDVPYIRSFYGLLSLY